MATPTKSQQEAEARARAENGVNPGEGTVDALETTIDDAGTGDVAPPQPAPRGEGEGSDAPPAPQTRPDSKRDAIIARFRSGRVEERQDAADEISEFARSGMPEEFRHPVPDLAPAEAAPGEGEGTAPAAEAAPEPPQPAAPQKYKVKVNGAERDLSLDELVANAQIALASKDILSEAKQIRDEVRGLAREVQQPVRADQSGHHTETHTRTAETVAPADEGAQDQGDPLQRLIETIQFGDPAEAKALLAQTIGHAAAEEVQKSLRLQRLQDEGARTANVLKEFEDQHQDLAKDPKARAAIEATVYEKQTEDLRQLGIDPTTFKTQSGVVTPADIAVAHRYYRAEGYKVRSPQQLLQEATDEFVEWKGGKKPNAEPPSPPAVETTQQGNTSPTRVVVDRTERRQAIQPQPSRAAAPRPASAQPAAQPRDRSQIVQHMQRQRGAPRGHAV